jgi:tetratricopeptide (TPR) repeat protein
MKSFSYPRKSAKICGFIFFCCAGCIIWFGFDLPPKISAEESRSEIENALFTRQEFFGAEAIVPLPTAEARENLAKLDEKFPDNPQILEKLAALDEKLARFDEAEKSLIRLAETDAARRENLAAFYHRRARFAAEADVLSKILFSIEAEKRVFVFERLIDLARIHDLPAYLNQEFYARVARENPEAFEVFQKLAEKLAEEKNYPEALRFLRDARRQFPDKESVLLEKEIEILLELNQPREAEKAYQAAFNPFWSSGEAEKFYEFLSRRDRLRAYGAEVKARFRKNPADFDAAIRLALYRNHDYEGGNDRIAPVILQLEKAKKNWTTEELTTVTRLLLQENEPDAASRFLYTLFLREDFQKNGELRARVLYQLFEMFSDAENEHLPLTKGDLRFYADVAQADTNPGMATGVLSLIFSDTDVREKLDEQETEATEGFNRAAAYRIFEAYKKEFPTAPELAQMYLDIVRLYTATKETEIAEKTLNEFAGRFENASDYPAVALKLADAFTATNQTEKEREVYQKILDYLGKNRQPKRDSRAGFDLSNNSSSKIYGIAPDRGAGIKIPKPEATPTPDYYYDEPEIIFRDYLARADSAITYAEVLERAVASLARENKTAEILALYSNEIAKYPDEEWLYERRLAWLEKTNLIDEQLKVYQAALARFQSRGWQDKLARWFLRQNRKQDFAEFSLGLIEKLNDREAENYLSRFTSVNVAPDEFEKQMYLKLYQTAHGRFPHNLAFANGLLNFYKAHRMDGEWRRLAAEYYFEAKEIRESFLSDLAFKGELRNYLEKAQAGEGVIYELFRADASVRLSNYENAVEAYRKLNRIYPNTPEFSARLVALTRSFGQKNRASLTEAADVSQARADFLPSSAEYRTTSGEIFAELGDYEKARAEWEKLPATARGDKEIYLDAATVYWDYFQYDDALRTIKILREKFADDALYAFEAGAILEARHETARAIGEYVKALGAKDDEDAQKEKAKKRLAFLAAKEANENSAANQNEIARTIEAEFQTQSRKAKDASFLTLGYAELLGEIEQPEKAENVLNRAILQSRDTEFLEAARDFYASADIESGERVALKRLAAGSESPRRTIKYYLQLAESFEKTGEREAARAIVSQTVEKFPLNYGVLTEASDFYRRLGFENESIAVLQNALPKSRGEYRADIAQKLAKRLISLNRLDDAAGILSSLHAEDRSDASIFRELAGVYVRTGKPELMRRAFAETVAALKQARKEKFEIDDEIMELRTSMIEAFTRLKDYESAIEQHIEIINREPENEELTENAIRYVRRYGGAEKLLNYYLRLSAEAFKNYRWQVVLARIYEANDDAENAARNYRAAIVNQPEMIELYVALADVETKRNDYDEAVKNLDTVLELTNDEAVYVKKKIKILKKAGRFAEVEAERAKLPAEPEKKSAAIDQFAEAEKLRATEKEKARELYREAFGKLIENPLGGELKAADIASYAQSARETESLAVVNERLWTLREKLLALAADEKIAGEARRRVSILEGALTESIGGIAKTFATDEELAALHENLSQKIENISFNSDKHGSLALVQDVSRRAGFGDLEEKILVRKLDKAKIDRHIDLQNLLSFYRERGAYQKAFDLLEKTGSDNLPLKAETARLVNHREKELEALRAIYQKPEKITATTDANVSRYLEILHAENRAELKSLTEKSSVFQLQLINFLLGRGERALAHAAIENAALPPVWKIARHAETSLALKEYDEDSECYFCAALQLDTIGEMVRQTPDKKRFLIGDEWFRLTREYGEWLKEKSGDDERARLESKKYVTAMIENLPRSADEQAKLGDFYLDRNAFDAAIEHFRLALESDEKTAVWAKLGAAYQAAGKTDLARDAWKKTLAEGDVESGLIYFQVLRKYGLAEKARESLVPVIVAFLVQSNAGDSINFQNLIRAVAASFGDETQKAAYFRRILNDRPTDTSLAEMLTNESLIGENERHEFYELLIARSDALDDYDYSFMPYLQRSWADAELIYEQENEYKTEEPENERYQRQIKYLEFLINRRDDRRAEQLTAIIEKDLNRRFARPARLRLAKINLQIRGGKFDLPEAEKFVGISLSESATEAKAPSVERFNDVLRVLKAENQQAQAAQISASFFARMLALEQFDAANFAGLARAFFQKGDAETARRILRLMIDAGSEAKRETALAETAALEFVQAKAPDAAKAPVTETSNIVNQANALALAAAVAAEFEQPDAAIEFRRALFEINPSDSPNRIELARLLLAKGDKTGAENILTQIIIDRDAARAARWQARMILLENGGNAEIPNANFDSFSQFYNGILAARNERRDIAAGFFINSLIADKEIETPARRQLIEFYAASGQFFAALKLAETDEAAKSDELLQTLSEAAEKIGDYAKAVELENAKSMRSRERPEHLQKLADEKNRRATDLTIDLENTRKL